MKSVTSCPLSGNGPLQYDYCQVTSLPLYAAWSEYNLLSGILCKDWDVTCQGLSTCRWIICPVACNSIVHPIGTSSIKSHLEFVVRILTNLLTQSDPAWRILCVHACACVIVCVCACVCNCVCMHVSGYWRSRRMRRKSSWTRRRKWRKMRESSKRQKAMLKKIHTTVFLCCLHSCIFQKSITIQKIYLLITWKWKG
jgi:hypothetical protein